MPDEKVMCADCGSEFNSQQLLDQHNRSSHGGATQMQGGQEYTTKGQEQDGR